MGLEHNFSSAIAKREREHRVAQHEANVRAYWTEPARAAEYANALHRRFEPVLFTNTILPANQYLEEFTKNYHDATKKDVPRLRKEFVKELGPGRWRKNFLTNWRETRNEPTVIERVYADAGKEEDDSALEGCVGSVIWGVVGFMAGAKVSTLIDSASAGNWGVAGGFIGAMGSPYWMWLTTRGLTSTFARSKEYRAAETEFDTTIAPQYLRAQTDTLEKLCREYRTSRGEVDHVNA